jgi:NADH-quinone oxidoreductase subunit M
MPILQVSHCGFVFTRESVLLQTALTPGAVMQMVSHGLMTALFLRRNYWTEYINVPHTRQVNEMGGHMKSMPFITTILFMVGLSIL